jgi:phosphohistidine phosphatase
LLGILERTQSVDTMKVLLAQHGDSLPEHVDPERPLSGRGRDDVMRMARLIGASGVRVTRIFHSGKLRARQTAELLAPHIASAAVVKAVSGLDPNDPVEPMANRVTEWTDDTLLVGHLPFMGRLVAWLVGAAGDRQVTAFQPGSVVCLERDAAGTWAIAWMLRPELLPR